MSPHHEHPHGKRHHAVETPAIAWPLRWQSRAAYPLFTVLSLWKTRQPWFRVKSYKKGFVTSDSNLKPTATLADVLELKEKTGHSTVAITEDGTPNGKLLGIVASRDYRVSRMSMDEPVANFMTPMEKLVYAPETAA